MPDMHAVLTGRNVIPACSHSHSLAWIDDKSEEMNVLRNLESIHSHPVSGNIQSLDILAVVGEMVARPHVSSD